MTSGWRNLSVLTCGLHMSVDEKEKKEARARSAAGRASAGLRVREKRWAGPVGLAWLFFFE